MNVAVITSIYGAYDPPAHVAPQDTPCEFVLVSDEPYGDAFPWRNVVEPRPQLHPRLAAKVAKCRPDLYAEADVYIWIDGSITITRGDFVQWCIDSLGDGVVAQIPHPDRHTIATEALFSATLPKYANLPVEEQAAHYHKEGFVDIGLWCGGVVVRRSRQAFGDAWLREQMRWTYQDQISEPYCLAHNGITPVAMDGPIYNNTRFNVGGHRDDQ